MSGFCGACIDEGFWVEERNKSDGLITLPDALENEGALQNHGLYTDEVVGQALEVGFTIRCLSIMPSLFFRSHSDTVAL